MIAPNQFTITLAATDEQRFSSFIDALVRELCDAAREYARDEKYVFLGPVTVKLQPDSGLGAGQFTVDAEVVEAAGGGPVGSVSLDDGRRVVMGDQPVAIGRMPECDIVLADPNVSRRHAEIRRSGSDFVVVDLGSTNGTKVNGAVIRERRLSDGDEITVGNTRLRFQAS